MTEPKIFSAVLVPHRSLGRRGFLLLMLILGGITAALFATETAGKTLEELSPTSAKAV